MGKFPLLSGKTDGLYKNSLCIPSSVKFGFLLKCLRAALCVVTELKYVHKNFPRKRIGRI